MSRNKAISPEKLKTAKFCCCSKHPHHEAGVYIGEHAILASDLCQVSAFSLEVFLVGKKYITEFTSSTTVFLMFLQTLLRTF